MLLREAAGSFNLHSYPLLLRILEFSTGRLKSSPAHRKVKVQLQELAPKAFEVICNVAKQSHPDWSRSWKNTQSYSLDVNSVQERPDFVAMAQEGTVSLQVEPTTTHPHSEEDPTEDVKREVKQKMAIRILDMLSHSLTTILDKLYEGEKEKSVAIITEIMGLLVSKKKQHKYVIIAMQPLTTALCIRKLQVDSCWPFPTLNSLIPNTGNGKPWKCFIPPISSK